MEALVQEIEFGRMLFTFILAVLGGAMFVTTVIHYCGGGSDV